MFGFWAYLPSQLFQLAEATSVLLSTTLYETYIVAQIDGHK